MTAIGPAPTRAIEPVSFDTIVVPVDGSPLSISAVGSAAALARIFGARVELVGFGDDAVEARALGGLLEALAAELNATSQTSIDKDVARGILETLAERERPLLCMASHGRGGLGAALMGSVATSLLATAPDPVLLVGPHLDPARTLDHWPTPTARTPAPTRRWPRSAPPTWPPLVLGGFPVSGSASRTPVARARKMEP